MYDSYHKDFSGIKHQFEKMSVIILSPITIPDSRWINCVVDMVCFSWGWGLEIKQMSHTYRTVVDWARENLAESAREKTDITHILWLDDDHVFYPNLACKLAGHFINPDVDIVSALYFSKFYPEDKDAECVPVAYVKDPSREYDESDPRDRFGHYPIVLPPNNLLEIDACGFGAVMMKRDVFDRVPQPWFTIDWRGGEDITFCKRAKENGVRVYLDGNARIGHVGPAPIIQHKHHIEYMKDKPVEKWSKENGA